MSGLALFVAGCAAPHPTGVLFTSTTTPVSGIETKYSKTGQASCVSYLSLYAGGDCSVEAAAKAGGITTIKSVDFQSTNYLGLYGKYTTIVKGD
ncbi:TRL-like family protein [Helicobacter sanguini]